MTSFTDENIVQKFTAFEGYVRKVYPGNYDTAVQHAAEEKAKHLPGPAGAVILAAVQTPEGRAKGFLDQLALVRPATRHVVRAIGQCGHLLYGEDGERFKEAPAMVKTAIPLLQLALDEEYPEWLVDKFMSVVKSTDLNDLAIMARYVDRFYDYTEAKLFTASTTA
jgi:hypothetical protein